MIKIIEKSDEKLKFETDIPISFANAIRRSVNGIPILAIDTLEISKNDSALYDEIIAHRAGLVPLKNEKLNLPEECDCKGKGCGKCSIKFKLKAKGPCVVYSSDLSPKENNVHNLVLTILDKDQELEFVAIAKMGTGKEHAKFTPGLFYYKYEDDEEKISVKDDEEKFKKLIEDVKKNENKNITVCIESWGQLKAKEIFTEAVNALNKNLKELIKKVK